MTNHDDQMKQMTNHGTQWREKNYADKLFEKLNNKIKSPSSLTRTVIDAHEQNSSSCLVVVHMGRIIEFSPV
jgi:hypothetical protein